MTRVNSRYTPTEAIKKAMSCHPSHNAGCSGDFQYRIERVPEGYVDFWKWARHEPGAYATGGRCWPLPWLVAECPDCHAGLAEPA